MSASVHPCITNEHSPIPDQFAVVPEVKKMPIQLEAAIIQKLPYPSHPMNIKLLQGL